MSGWIFLEDFVGVRHGIKLAVNLESVATVTPRFEDHEMVIFFSKGHIDPYALTFKSKEACAEAYEDLKELLKYHNKKTKK